MLISESDINAKIMVALNGMGLDYVSTSNLISITRGMGSCWLASLNDGPPMQLKVKVNLIKLHGCCTWYGGREDNGMDAGEPVTTSSIHWKPNCLGKNHCWYFCYIALNIHIHFACVFVCVLKIRNILHILFYILFIFHWKIYPEFSHVIKYSKN